MSESTGNGNPWVWTELPNHWAGKLGALNAKVLSEGNGFDWKVVIHGADYDDPWQFDALSITGIEFECNIIGNSPTVEDAMEAAERGSRTLLKSIYGIFEQEILGAGL